MKGKNASPLTGVLILGSFVVLAASVLFGVRGKLTAAPHEAETVRQSWATEAAASERPVQDPNPPPRIALTAYGENPRPGAKVRNLEQYYSRRAYPGAPPGIPHPVANDGVIADACLSCHKEGGFVPEYNAYTPITGHPEYENCRQCHVPQTVETLFVQTEWTVPEPSKRGQQAIPGGPLQMPHSLHFRSNCKACHVGPQAVVEIRCSHPERENCQQCHVPQDHLPPFESQFDPRITHAEK